MNKSDIKIDKNTLAPEDFENTKLITLDDGSMEEVYISRAGNIVTNPKDRAVSRVDHERRQLCWDLYIKSIKNGSPSARNAALEAGFAPNTAQNIKSLPWFKKKLATLRQSKMMSNAEANVSRALRVQWSKMKTLEDGSEVEEIDKDLFKTVVDTSWRVLETLGKDRGYTKKTEIDGNMNGEIKINSVSYADNPQTIESAIQDKIIDVVEQSVLEEVKEEQ